MNPEQGGQRKAVPGRDRRFSGFPFVYAVEENMNQYILMLHSDPKAFSRDHLSPQRFQEIYGKYRAWRDRMASEGKLTGGNKLEDETGRVMRAESGSGKVHITDGPYTESKEVIGGFFVVKAENYEEAVKIASDCPHLEYGTIEIRRIEVVSVAAPA
jgi:hypothetical protein